LSTGSSKTSLLAYPGSDGSTSSLVTRPLSTRAERHAEIEHAKRKRPDSLDAYDLYLRAVPHLRVNMPSEADKALGLLRQALSIQPDYPAAHAAAALCHEQRYMRGGLQEVDKAAALEHARAAIEAGADDAETLATAGFAIGLVTHDYETALNAIERGLRINATSVLALVFGAIILGHAGHAERAVEYAERALRSSPLDPWISNSHTALGIAYCSVGNWEAVASAFGKAIEANPRFSLPQVLQAAALSVLGRDAEARAGVGEAGVGVGTRLHRKRLRQVPFRPRGDLESDR
jgi:tetratricopeptide (TPR) repeat protein